MSFITSISLITGQDITRRMDELSKTVISIRRIERYQAPQIQAKSKLNQVIQELLE